MEYYIRMIGKKGQWEEDKGKEIGEIRSDIVTNCLRTSGNTLSLWKIDSTEETEEALIALSSNRDRLQKLDYILIPAEVINNSGLVLKKSEGKSPYLNFNDKHYDITSLNYDSLGKVVKLVLDLINKPECNIERKGQGVIEDLLLKAISESKIKKETLKDTLAKELGEISLKKSICQPK